MKILFVDDCPDRTECFKRRFPDADTAADYDEAVEKLKQAHYELVSLDHDLGWGKNGLDIVDFICFEMEKKPDFVKVHSMNPSGAMRMVQTLMRYDIPCEMATFRF